MRRNRLARALRKSVSNVRKFRKEKKIRKVLRRMEIEVEARRRLKAKLEKEAEGRYKYHKEEPKVRTRVEVARERAHSMIEDDGNVSSSKLLTALKLIFDLRAGTQKERKVRKAMRRMEIVAEAEKRLKAQLERDQDTSLH